MGPTPRCLLQRRWVLLRFALGLSGATINSATHSSFRPHMDRANHFAFCRWLIVTQQLTDWPTTLPSETTPLRYFLERPQRRS